MKKSIIGITLFTSLSLVGCSQSNNSEKEIYNIKQNEKIEVGIDVPEGSYTLTSDKEALTFQTIKDDTSSSSQILINNEGEDYIEYDIILKTNTSIIISEDSTLTEK